MSARSPMAGHGADPIATGTSYASSTSPHRAHAQQPYKSVASGEEKDELLLGKSSLYAAYPPMPTGCCLCCLTPASWAWLVRHATTLFWVSAMVGVLGGMTLSLGLTGRSFSRDCPDYAPYYYHGCMTNAEYFGVIVMVLLVPVGVLALGAGIQMFSRRAHAPRCRPTVVLTLLAVAMLVFSFVAIVMYTMVEPELTYENKKIDYLLVFYGGFLVSVFTPIGAAVLAIAWNIARPKPSLNVLRPAGRTASEMGRMGQSKGSGLPPSNSFAPDTYPTEPLEPNTCAQNWGMLTFGFFVLVIAYWMTTIFTCIWNWYAGSYFAWKSPYNLWTWAISEKFNFKFYKDTLVYYSFLMGVLLFGTMAHFLPCLRRCTSKRIRVHSPTHRWYLPYTYGVSVGELILLAGVFALFGWWLYFWRYDYKRIETKAYKGEEPHWKPDANAELHIAARVTGHLTALAFAFLMLPVAKNSLWESALGIPFERALKYHRGMGVVMYLLCTMHMLFWWVKWFHEGIFWWNLTRVDYFRVNPYDNHYDDFTVNLMTLLWAGCTVMIIIALWWRRSNYNLFYITHLFSIIFLVGTIMHAWSFWYFAVGPCFLWFYDRMVRLKRASTQTTPMLALDYSPATGCTRVELPRETFHFHAGQYAYLQIAELSPLAWHPFTVSSAPSAPTRTFHIKAEAPGSWTYRLARLAESMQGRSELPVLAVDAAYGRSNYIHGHRALLMIGGGIGITPFTSLFTELYTRFCVAERDSVPLDDTLSNLRKVHLVFTARSEAMLTMFSSLIYAISQHNPRGLFQVDLHATGPAQSDVEAPLSPSEYDGEPAALVYTRSKIIRSRPNFDTIARELDHHSPGRLTLAMACGPAAVVDRVSELSFARNYDFHHEVFHF